MKVKFSDRVYDVVKGIQKGDVLTYKEVAKKAGSPGAYRYVGSLMKKDYDPEIPCHRVVRSDGKVGEYNRGGSQVKKALLESESDVAWGGE